MPHRTPPRPGLTGVAALGIWALVLAWTPSTPAQVSPAESARQLRPADGLEASLWAAEPLVVNPTTIDVDSRGRVWVTEGLNYRLTRGGNKKFSRIEEADTVKILEDTDGDGTADKVTIFADRIFPVPMGIAVEERYGTDGAYLGCKVYVGNSPNLLVLEDSDGDDKADKRYPLLTGFGGIDSDHGVHGMVFGPDGKLYFTHGDGCCSVQPDRSERVQNFDVTDRSGRHVWSDQLANTLRVNRDGTGFEILADRQRNNYETCLNSFGNGFTSDNDDDGNRGCRIIWVLDGGSYGYRTPGSARHWGEEAPGNVPKLVGTGNGSPCGVMVYEGDLLPEEYRGGLLEAEAGPRQINFFPLVRKGAAFRTQHKVMLASDDPWFRPVDVTAAPDGSVFVADWYDAGVGGHAFRDQTTGRIYRVAPKGSKPKAVAVDFATIPGLIAALKSPVVATRDTARRLLIERGKEANKALQSLFLQGEPIHRARALWVLNGIQGEPIAEFALQDKDPRIREQAVRILGRDARENGHVAYARPEAKQPPPAAAHREKLLPLAGDPDAGVRRELILALRNLPTAQVGAALKSLARSWDGQDRWYLEALGLALRDREPAFLAELFDGTLYGDLDLDEAGQATTVALPPYFPVDRNEAYLAAGEPDLPANALTRTIGLAWMIHRAEALPVLTRILPKLATPDLQQAADDVLSQVSDPAGAVAVAELAQQATDPVRKRQLLTTLARRLEGAWSAARNRPQVVEAIDAAVNDPETRAEGITIAAATGERRYAEALMAFARDEAAAVEVRVAAVEAVGQLKPPGAQALIDGLIAAARQTGSSSPVAEAAVRTLPRLAEARGRLADLVSAPDVPLGLRREALRLSAQQTGGALRIVDLARQGKLPADLTTEATTVLNTHPDGRVRDAAARVLPLPKTAAGRPLPPFFELVRREGDAGRGRAVFSRTAPNGCASCHRVQGRGQWVGPDLSTIGTKYGKDELLRSILNPSAAVGYNYRSYVVALADGRVITGLPVEEAADRLILKTAEGQRLVLQADDIEEKKQSDLSLMPENLAQTMSDQDLVDLLAFLSTLRQPVSLVGVYHALGPVAEGDGPPALDPRAKLDPSSPVRGPDGQRLSWRRVTANAESLVDLGPLVGTEVAKAVYLYAPVVSPVAQEARLVIDTRAEVRVWLNGQPLDLPTSSEDASRSAAVGLPRGASALLIRVAGGPDAAVVTTFVADRPLEFSPAEAATVSAR